MSGSFALPESPALRAAATSIADSILQRDPALARRYGERGRNFCIEDTLFHLTFLSFAVLLRQPKLFLDYVGWAKVLLIARGIPPADLERNLSAMRSAVGPGLLPEESGPILDAAIDALAKMPESVPSFIDDTDPLGAVAAEYLRLTMRGERRAAESFILGELDEGIPLQEIYLEVFEPVQHEIGRLWQMNRINVAQEHFCTAATQGVMARLYGRLFTGQPRGLKILAACVGEELHEIGLRMVSDLLEINGWDSTYLGANVPTGSLVEAVAETRPSVIALSATLTSHLGRLSEMIAALRGDPRTSNVPILVGGYPFRIAEGLAARMGADGSGRDAAAAIVLAEELARRNVR